MTEFLLGLGTIPATIAGLWLLICLADWIMAKYPPGPAQRYGYRPESSPSATPPTNPPNMGSAGRK